MTLALVPSMLLTDSDDLKMLLSMVFCITGKCYMHPLILPCLPATHASATAANSIDVALATDPNFAATCEHAAIQAIYAYQEEEYATLHEMNCLLHP